MKPTRRSFRVHADDNVATVLEDVCAGEGIVVLGEGIHLEITCKETLSLGHKVALCPILAGEEVIKFGVAIGIATAAIAPGAWVHLHNCRSCMDDRSSAFDVKTGAATDTRYE